MTIHRSLAIKGVLTGNRSVLTRMERLKKLEKEGKWKDGESIFGLPKVRTQFRVAKKKKKEAAATPDGAAPAAAAGEVKANDAKTAAKSGAKTAAKPAAKPAAKAAGGKKA